MSKFAQKQLGQMHLLIRRGKHDGDSRAKCLVFCGIGEKVSYEFFTDRSGLPDGRFAMLVTGVGRSLHAPVLRAMVLIVLTAIC